jgi:hypothetical protein
LEFGVPEYYFGGNFDSTTDPTLLNQGINKAIGVRTYITKNPNRLDSSMIMMNFNEYDKWRKLYPEAVEEIPRDAPKMLTGSKPFKSSFLWMGIMHTVKSHDVR